MNPKCLPALIVGTLLLSACGNKPNPKENALAEQPAATAHATPEIKPFQTVSARTKTEINDFLGEYLAISEMLINDSLPGAKVMAAKFSESIKKFEMSNLTTDQMDFYMVESSTIKQALNGIAQTLDIETARTELAKLSSGMYALVKAFHPNESPLYYQYCPMAQNGQGASWLSKTKEIVNPYMGQMMPECGRNKEVLN